ncbi:hypothetical protein KR222_010716 [Zaprionus bogoriensis]|nr:hypothetical protein KR222_010716 [Zaprionus bogoriensis]
MLRLLLLPLFLFTLSMVCMGQTFQYSRGWTNGKRAPPAAFLTNGHNLGLLDLYEMQDAPSDRRLERCLSHLQHLTGNNLLHRSFANGLAYEGSRPDSEPEPVRGLNLRSRTTSSSSSNNNSNNNDNSLYGNSVNHRQSSELYEALNAAVAASGQGGESVEPNDYGKGH